MFSCSFYWLSELLFVRLADITPCEQFGRPKCRRMPRLEQAKREMSNQMQRQIHSEIASQAH